jgi:creatinine amidohydrolase
MKIKLEEMSWPEVDEVLKQPNVVILPVGAIEQHGLHLPLDVDARCSAHIAEQVARKVIEEHKIGVLVAPTVYYGETSTFRGFPGTIGVSVDTLVSMIRDVVRSFISQGFNNIVVVNGHSGNTIPIAIALRKASIDFPDAGLYAVNWWDLGFDVIPNIRKSETGLHADELETSLSLVIQPENVHMEKAVKDIPSYSLSSRWVVPDLQQSPKRVFYHSRKGYPKRPGERSGVMGDATVASRETGEKIISAVVDDLAKIIVEIVGWEGTHHELEG